MKKKNIILMGANGAGKTSLANIFYHKGYHKFKLSPLASDSEISVIATLESNNVVFDRWSPIDLAIYRKDETLLKRIIELKDRINSNNIIFYLENFNEYDESSSSQRVIQRPKFAELFEHIQTYRNYVKSLSDAGLKIFHIHVSSDANETLELIERRIRENE